MDNYFLNPKVLPRASDPDALILHPHAQRTGGNTMRNHVLSAALGEERVYCRKRNGAVKWRELTAKDVAGFKAVTDHFDFRDNPKIGRPLLPIAVLRHPLYRAVSIYHFVRRKKTHREHAMACALELEPFYEKASLIYPRYYRNLQCRRVCGVDDARIALEWIDEKFLGVGFTEHLGDFANALAGAMGWRALEIEEGEPDAARYEAEITPSFRERVLGDNAEDLLLWETMVKGAPLALPKRAAKDEARTVVNRAKQWVKDLVGR
ncbi:MAG TPA: hypothetical protein VG889_17265 [Rhizomicrobium sp.]|nr:hypothetical protein [Rhizomicrobium sp.]